MPTHNHNKWLLAPLVTPLLLLGSMFNPTPSFAQTDPGLQRSPWKMHRGIAPPGKENDIADIALSNYDDSKGFDKINIPPADDAGWVTPPRDSKNNISLDEKSALADCAKQVDFTYFQTEVYVPKDAKITDFQVTFDQVDDLARIYILNTKRKDAHSNDIVGKSVETSDLLPLIALGEKNRVVIAQFDSCADRNSIKNIQIEVKVTGADGKAIEEIIPTANRFYVDKDAKGKASGLTWTDAYTNVQDALAVVAAGTEVWVADGVYYPDVGGKKKDNDRSASFFIPSGVALYGGFTGKEKALTERNWIANVTVLSGDIDQNDKANAKGVVTTTKSISGANSFHVVSLNGLAGAITGTTSIDGFAITAGQANGPFAETDPKNMGGGLICNAAKVGAECSPRLMNVAFSGNLAAENGGAMINLGGPGGKSNPTLTNVIFSGNAATYGGALYNYGGVKGDSSPALTNVVFSGNSARRWGGAILNQGENQGKSAPALVNITFTGNSAEMGGAVFNYGDRDGNSSPVLTNVILWKNTAQKGPSIYNQNAKSTIGYSIVENSAASIAGEGTNSSDYKPTNKSDDPSFVAGAAATPCEGLQLKVGSPAIGVGDPKALPASVTTDLVGANRVSGGKVSPGACEFVK